MEPSSNNEEDVLFDNPEEQVEKKNHPHKRKSRQARKQTQDKRRADIASKEKPLEIGSLAPGESHCTKVPFRSVATKEGKLLQKQISRTAMDMRRIYASICELIHLAVLEFFNPVVDPSAPTKPATLDLSHNMLTKLVKYVYCKNNRSGVIDPEAKSRNEGSGRPASVNQSKDQLKRNEVAKANNLCLDKWFAWLALNKEKWNF